MFKAYVKNQELILESHLVRVVKDAVKKIDVGSFPTQYKGGGTSSCHPKMLFKVFVSAERIYSSRRIAKAWWENIHLT